MTGTVRSFPAEAVLFDLDGVLVESTTSIERAWLHWADGHGLPWEAVRPHVHGRHAVDTIRALLADLGPAELERQAREVMRRQVTDTAGLAPVPGMPELVRALAGPWAVVTGCSRDLAIARLRATGYPPPPVLVTADDGLPGKPDPTGYQLAAARLGLQGRPCVVLEDTAAGVAAGRAAGMAVIGVLTTHEAADLTGAAVIVPDGRLLRADRRGQVMRIVIDGRNGNGAA